MAVYASHWPLLPLPYFWDEAGYYIPAAIDFFRTGSLIPHSTLTNAHPPLPAILLSGWWTVAGTAISGTRTFMVMLAASALLGVFRLARLLAGPVAATVVTVLTGLYPVWFAQSTLAHADLFAAVFTLWGLSVYFERFTEERRVRPFWLAALFTLAALSKETAIVTPVCLAMWELVLQITERSAPDTRSRSFAGVGTLAALLFPTVPLALWYAYHLRMTGFLFGNPEFLRYNATANLSVARVLTSLWHRVIHLTFHMNLWLPIAVTVAVLFGPRLLPNRTTALERPVSKALLVILLGNTLAFSVLGGALLTRYLLPMYPLELLICVAVWQERFRPWQALAGLTAAGFVAALFLNPPYSIAPEDNLTYRDMIELHQQAINFVARHYPQATVLTAWPATTELGHPELGYIRQPVKTDAIDNFSFEQIEKAAADPGGYDTALVFSTKWVPPSSFWNLGRSTEATDRRFYDFHRDLSPAEVARLLHGDVVWQGAQNGEWAAVLRFPRVVEAGDFVERRWLHKAQRR